MPAVRVKEAFLRISVQLLLALGGLVIVLIAALAGLAQLRFSSFLAESVEERLEIVAATSAQDFSAAIDLGLGLGEVANGEAILERARSHDPNIEVISVFDLEGNVLHSVGGRDSQRIGEETFEAFRLAGAGITEPQWGIESGDSISMGVVVEGSFGQPVGGIAIEYPTTDMSRQTGIMTRRLFINGVIVAAAMGLVVLLLLRLFRARLTALEPS